MNEQKNDIYKALFSTVAFIQTHNGSETGNDESTAAWEAVAREDGLSDHGTGRETKQRPKSQA